MPGPRGTDIRSCPVVLRNQLLRPVLTGNARREPRAMLASQHRRRCGSLELDGVDVPTARDAVNMLGGRTSTRARGCKGFAFALRQLLGSLHRSSAGCARRICRVPIYRASYASGANYTLAAFLERESFLLRDHARKNRSPATAPECAIRGPDRTILRQARKCCTTILTMGLRA